MNVLTKQQQSKLGTFLAWIDKQLDRSAKLIPRTELDEEALDLRKTALQELWNKVEFTIRTAEEWDDNLHNPDETLTKERKNHDDEDS